MIKTTLFYSLILLIFSGCEVSGESDKKIKASQIGYHPHSQKNAVIPIRKRTQFFVKDKHTGKIVYSGVISKPKRWKYSGELVGIADFSELNTLGEFIISCPDNFLSESYSFKIERDIYSRISQASLHSFYLARSSVQIKEEFAGKYSRPMGHPDDSVIVHPSASSPNRPAGTIISATKGWYDAGDYNKYIVNSGISTFTLLHLFEQYSDHYKSMRLNIPENRNKLPDILDEILWNLRWMLQMQDPYDGGVYHKLTTRTFGTDELPHKQVGERYVVMKTTAATLDLAAVCAKAYRVFKTYNDVLPGFADSCITASKNAWDWANKNPKVRYIEPDDINTGIYGDKYLKDERVWASIELFITTSNENYLIDNFQDYLEFNVPMWRKVSTLAVYSILTDTLTNQNKIKKDYIREMFLAQADKIFSNYKSSAYRVSLNEFRWGSNGFAASEGVYLLNAYYITKNNKYLEAAEAIMHYLTGINPIDICYITGFGSKSPQDIHDRRSKGDNIDEPLPGLLVGGPNENAGKDCGYNNYQSKYPAVRYLDMNCSYSTNEIAINWNAPFAYLSGAIQSIYNDKH